MSSQPRTTTLEQRQAAMRLRPVRTIPTPFVKTLNPRPWQRKKT